MLQRAYFGQKVDKVVTGITPVYTRGELQTET